MVHVMYCPIHKEVWAYDHGDVVDRLEQIVCYDCSDDELLWVIVLPSIPGIERKLIMLYQYYWKMVGGWIAQGWNLAEFRKIMKSITGTLWPRKQSRCVCKK